MWRLGVVCQMRGLPYSRKSYNFSGNFPELVPELSVYAPKPENKSLAQRNFLIISI